MDEMSAREQSLNIILLLRNGIRKGSGVLVHSVGLQSMHAFLTHVHPGLLNISSSCSISFFSLTEVVPFSRLEALHMQSLQASGI